jgi:molybdopterin-guanine dinucleotide biosynthesis protein A
MDRRGTSLIVLAGGESRRFGSPKALALWRGKRLIDHVFDRLSPHSEKTITVTNPLPQEPDWPGDAVLRDDPSLPAGPLRGIVRGLAECESEWAWVVSCDTPLVMIELLSALRDEARPGDVAVTPVWRGLAQPLVACWEAAAAPALKEILEAGEHSPGAALGRLGRRPFPEEACGAIDPKGASFFNVNTPEDLEGLDRLAPAGGATRSKPRRDTC